VALLANIISPKELRRAYTLRLREILLTETFYNSEVGQAILDRVLNGCIDDINQALKAAATGEESDEQIVNRLRNANARKKLLNEIEALIGQKIEVLSVIQKQINDH